MKNACKVLLLAGELAAVGLAGLWAPWTSPLAGCTLYATVCLLWPRPGKECVR